ncbi:glycosyltransferase family 39 protein [Deltaproteobacteria bacterium]|nr:glycosyltransferase family 39 protein [Deltaproteobacteria bacterium]
MDRESPPLIKCIPAITSIITKPTIDTALFESEPNPWSLGYHFMYNNWDKYKDFFQYGRFVIIILGCLLGWLLYRFGMELYGKSGGLLALFLFVFNPNIIAHSRLITIDIGASCTIFLSIYCFRTYLKRKDLFFAIVVGFTLGLAQLSKFTALLLYPIFLIIIGILAVKKDFLNSINSSNNGKPQTVRDIGHFLVIISVSLLVINAGYLFSGTFRSIGDYQFLSGPLRTISAMLWEAIPVPLPYEYISGFDSQMAISEGNNLFYTSYLMGEHSLEGWWYYYIIAFIVKNPLAFFLILIIAIITWIKKGGTELEDGLCLWIPVIGFFLYFSSFTHIPIGVRFLLPVFPLLFLAAGNIVNAKFLKNKTGKIIISVLAIAYLIPALSNYPNYLSYFNMIAGGSGNGHRWLIDSNLDWGQDLPGLKKYMEKNGIEEIKLGYFGRVDPEIYGIKYTLPENNLEQGYYAISVNFLVGRPYYLLKENPKELLYVGMDYFKKYRLLKPVEIINNTIYIFDVENGSI